MRKRYWAEFIGTFLVVFAPVAVSAIGQQGPLIAALVSGLAVLAAISAFGPISAAHYNPAVTLGFAAAGRFPWRFVVPYVSVQCCGGLVAALVSRLLFGVSSGAHKPLDPSLLVRNFGTEALLGFMLMLVIIAVATDRRVSSTLPPLAIGFTVVLGVLIGGPVTGGSMNPARSLGPAVLDPSAIPFVWLYLLAPTVGAIAAARVYESVRLEPRHSTGAPSELLDALADISSRAEASH